eukprot:TRINITY_DN1296_c0_g1_i2.p1 TRINITY_DN1296_c0_g1~~TRINITY_DN1296_c0_g1_i2.p1  ORF type:complete len:362 (+),score=76.60 TRINITY_DN1296_c0_g1_i2:217-1302(+)
MSCGATGGGAAARVLGPIEVIGFGHPLLDISTHVDTGYLEKYHVSPGQTMLANPDQLSVYQDISERPDVEYVPGGATMNAIRVCQWLLPGSCRYSGTIGSDQFGSVLLESLKKAGVTPLLERNSEHPTGTCACLIVGKERSLIANLGAAIQFSMKHFNSPDVQQAIQRAGIFYSAGFFLNTASSPEAPLAIAKHCAEQGKVFAMNLSAPYLCDAFKDVWSEVMPYVDYLFGNKNDALAYSSAQGWGATGDHLSVAMRLAQTEKKNNSRPRVVIVTHGSDPTVVATADGITEYATPVLASDHIVDLNGAGDAFVGGFLSQLAQHRPLDECIQAGQYAAEVIIRHHGCSFPDQPDYNPERASE